MNYEQRESMCSVSSMRDDGFDQMAATGTAFRKDNGTLAIFLTTTCPNNYTHPQCTDVFTFAQGNFRTAALEGSCFGSSIAPDTQYIGTFNLVRCP